MKKLSMLTMIIALFAVAAYTYGQCTSGEREVKVMCIEGSGMGGECSGLAMESCCGGMSHACMCQGGMGKHEMGGCDKRYYLCCADELELNDDQRKRLKEIRFEHQKSTIHMRAYLEIMELEFEELLHQTSPDRAAVGQKITAMGELTTKIKKNHVLTRLDARSVLTKEQLENCLGGHCGCFGMGTKNIREHKSCSKTESCPGMCIEESKKCIGQCK